MTQANTIPSEELPTEAIAQLRDHQRQLDPDGVIVGVSRQAIDEVLAFMEATRPTTPETIDEWNPRNEDPYWMLEAEDGEWLKNERTLSGTRDAAKALRFPTQAECYNHPARMTAGSKWWAAKPTEHLWIGRPTTPEQPSDAIETIRRAIWTLVPGRKEATVDAIAEAAFNAMQASIGEG